MDIDRLNKDEDVEPGTDDLDVAAIDAEAITGGALIARDDDALPEHECKG